MSTDTNETLEDMIGRLLKLTPVEMSDMKQLRRIQAKLEEEVTPPDEVLSISLKTLQTFINLWVGSLAQSKQFLETPVEDVFKVAATMGMAIGYRKAVEDLT